ncbi:hypothetical protein KAJ27_17340 [bacterium]|nr:hypothetical protein [bacterium]
MRTLQINLLPEKKKKFKMPSIPIFPIVCFIILGGLGYFLFIMKQAELDMQIEEKNQEVSQARQRMKNKLSDKQDQLNKVQRAVNEARKTVEKLKSLTGVDKLPWTDVWKDLSEIVPPQLVWIKSFSYDQTGRVSMNCVGIPVDTEDGTKLDELKVRDYGSIEEFLTLIKNNSHFTNPFCSNASVGKMFNKTIVNFSMSCKIKKSLGMTNMGGN